MTDDAEHHIRPWLVGSVAICGLGLALRLSGELNVWLLTVSVSALVISAAFFRNAGLLYRLRSSRRTRPVAYGLLTGIGLALLTWLSFEPVTHVLPVIERQVSRLYASLAVAPDLPWSLALLFVVVVAEELAFREILLTSLVKQFGKAPGIGLSLLLYALPQAGAAEWIMIPLAVALGAVWTAQRLMSGSLLLPLTTHFVWSSLILEIFPLTSR